jgi:hypothetical protein
MKGRLGWVVALVVTGSLCAPRAEAKILVVPPRPGQLGVGVTGQFAGLTSSGDIGSLFGSGGGIAVRVRYRMRYERAIGITFEQENFDARHSATADTMPVSEALTNTSIEFYQLYGTRTNTTRMLSAGFGLTQVRRKLKDGDFETGFPEEGDGGFISVGAGLEKFFYQSLAIDLSTHYKVIFQNHTTNHSFQVAAGLIFYASY